MAVNIVDGSASSDVTTSSGDSDGDGEGSDDDGNKNGRESVTLHRFSSVKPRNNRRGGASSESLLGDYAAVDDVAGKGGVVGVKCKGGMEYGGCKEDESLINLQKVEDAIVINDQDELFEDPNARLVLRLSFLKVFLIKSY